MVAAFLHHFPQYKLQDLQDGTLSLPEVLWLHAGMMDNLAPEATESVEEQVARQTRAAALKAHERTKRERRRGW